VLLLFVLDGIGFNYNRSSIDSSNVVVVVIVDTHTIHSIPRGSSSSSSSITAIIDRTLSSMIALLLFMLDHETLSFLLTLSQIELQLPLLLCLRDEFKLPLLLSEMFTFQSKSLFLLCQVVDHDSWRWLIQWTAINRDAVRP